MKRTDLNSFNTGGKHSENENGGILMGQGQNGQPNTVEQGETMKSGFVYSDTVKLNKNTLKQFNLPKSWEGKTIAEVSKVIDNKFKDRNDKISISTKTGMLDLIGQAQESIKAESQPNKQQVDQNQMFLGGDIAGGDMSSMMGMPGVSDGLQGISSLASGDKDQALRSGIKAAGTIGGTAIGGPIGGAIGGMVGDFAGSFVGKRRMQREAEQLSRDNAIASNSVYTSDFKYGGKMNNYAVGGPLQPSSIPDPNYIPNLNGRQLPLDNNYINQQNLLSTENTLPTYDVQTPTDTFSNNIQYPKGSLKPAVDWLGNNYGDIMRYAPVAANALQLANLKKPGYENLNRLNNHYQQQYVDERSLQNIAGNELDNVSNSLAGVTNGSSGALRSNLLGASLNRGKTLSDSYLNANAQNRQQNQVAQQFNLNVDQTNLQQSNQELDINDRNQASYRNAKSKLIAQLGSDIGEIGKEQVLKKIATTMYGYRSDGSYFIKPDGTKISKDEFKKEVEAENNPNSKKLGGMLLNKNK